MTEAQVIAKTWKRRMRQQISNDDQLEDYADYNRNFNDVYNMIQEHQEEYESDHEQQEEAKMGGMCSFGGSKPKSKKASA